MFKLTLFDPAAVRLAVVLSPYVLPDGRAFVTISGGEIGMTFSSREDADAFKARLVAALDAAITYE